MNCSISAAFNLMIAEIEQVASRSTAPMLLMGPTGAGKSQLARRIYELKASRHCLSGPFVEVNCATLKGDSAMSALFGHKKGAFTGAMADRLGLLRSADGGMLFLDEIGELGLDEQAMILRAVEEGRFLPLGADKEVTSRFQLIAGTSRELLAEVTAGRFRENLFARLNLWTFRLPSLAERPEDIEPNLDYEMERFAAAQDLRVTFNKEVREVYRTFATSPAALWRGEFPRPFCEHYAYGNPCTFGPDRSLDRRAGDRAAQAAMVERRFDRAGHPCSSPHRGGTSQPRSVRSYAALGGGVCMPSQCELVGSRTHLVRRFSPAAQFDQRRRSSAQMSRTVWPQLRLSVGETALFRWGLDRHRSDLQSIRPYP